MHVDMIICTLYACALKSTFVPDYSHPLLYSSHCSKTWIHGQYWAVTQRYRVTIQICTAVGQELVYRQQLDVMEWWINAETLWIYETGMITFNRLLTIPVIMHLMYFLPFLPSYYHFCTADVNECTSHDDICHDNAACQNTQGGYTCSCNHGYIGDGFSCTGKLYICKHGILTNTSIAKSVFQFEFIAFKYYSITTKLCALALAIFVMHS